MPTFEEPCPKITEAKKQDSAVLEVDKKISESIEENLFETEAEARKYLEEQVPPKEQDKKVDLAAFKERLFDTPETPTPGHYEFEGKNGLCVSFDLVEGNHHFDRCWQVYGRNLTNETITGKLRPIFLIQNLKITTDDFKYDKTIPSKPISITWLPGLHRNDTELSPSTVHIEKGEIYLTGEEGLFSRPLDLLGFFHELGHIETNHLLPSYSTLIMGFPRGRTITSSAHELRREKFANNWIMQNTKRFFQNLDIAPELVQEYCEQLQLRSYYEVCRRMLESNPEKKE